MARPDWRRIASVSTARKTAERMWWTDGVLLYCPRTRGSWMAPVVKRDQRRRWMCLTIEAA